MNFMVYEFHLNANEEGGKKGGRDGEEPQGLKNTCDGGDTTEGQFP